MGCLRYSRRDRRLRPQLERETDVPARRIVGWIGIGASKFFDWKKRYGKANEHNAMVPRDHWLEKHERKSIINFHSQHSLDGYRRMTYMMMDADIVAASPATGLIRRKRVKIHMTLGIAGMIVYAGFFVATSYIYLTRLLSEGSPEPLAMFVFASFLIVKGFLIRKQDPERHKTNIIIGTFMLMEPGISRSIGHLFGKGSEPVWLLTYLNLFGVFVWYYRKISWQIAVGFAIWLIGTVNIVISMG